MTADPTPPLVAPPPAESAHASGFRRGARWFFAEFLVVVAGILVAMSLSAWYQGRQDARSELSYLQLLSRDLQDTLQDLEATATFEGRQIESGLLAYRGLSESAGKADHAAVSSALSRLSQRKTMLLRNSTYQDLVSTGNFHLIRDAALRDRIAEFYQRTGLQYDVINRNNSFFVDSMFTGKIVSSGLVINRLGSNLPELDATDMKMDKALAGGYLAQPDPLWSLPADDPQWAMLKSTLISRIRIASLGNSICRERAAAARTLKQKIDAQIAQH